MANVIGLDFGNTRMYPSVVRENDPLRRINSTPISLMPALFADYAGIPSSFFYSERRGEKIGKEAEDARPDSNRVNLLKKKIHEGALTLDGRQYEYPELIKKVIHYGVSAALEKMHEDFQEDTWDICLAYPVTYNSEQRDKLIELVESVKIDGKNLVVVGTITEPAAAALDYLAEFGQGDQKVLVYDLGGGTFDAAVVSAYPHGKMREDGSTYFYDIVVQNGDEHLGGADFNTTLRNICNRLLGEANLDASSRNSMAATIERAKIALSTNEEYIVTFYDVDGDPIDITLTRSDFEREAKPLIDRSIDIIRQMLEQHTDVAKILMTGGASKMPMVRNALMTAFPSYADSNNIISHRADKAISFGAARYGRNERNNVQARLVWDLGIYYFDMDKKRGYVSTLIKAGTPVPYTAHVDASLNKATDRCITKVYEACTPKPDMFELAQWNYVFYTELVFDRKASKGTTVVDQLEVDRHGNLTVTSWEKARSRRNRATATGGRANIK